MKFAMSKVIYFIFPTEDFRVFNISALISFCSLASKYHTHITSDIYRNDEVHWTVTYFSPPLFGLNLFLANPILSAQGLHWFSLCLELVTLNWVAFEESGFLLKIAVRKFTRNREGFTTYNRNLCPVGLGFVLLYFDWQFTLNIGFWDDDFRDLML